jgi:predicted phage terminase large subunit-like protein
MNNPQEEVQALYRSDLNAFFERAFWHLNPARGYIGNWHIELLASELTACFEGRTKRLIICLPPRNLKSHCASVSFPAWLLARDPSAQIMCVSYAQDLADKHARDCRSIMTSEWYQKMSPTRLAPDKQAVAEFATTQNGFRLATSIGGVLTGRGADIVIIDDPLKPDEALSETQRKTVNEWYSNTLYSRLNDKECGCIIIIMQRLHLDDLVGHVIDKEDWKIVSLPAIAEQEEEHVINTLWGQYTHSRHVGEALHPEHESLESFARTKEMIDSYNWAAQYQQSPVPAGGAIIKRDWFRIYDPHQQPTDFDLVIQSWDTANKATQLSDHSVCITVGVKGNQIYVLNVFRKRLNYPDLKRAVGEQQQLFNPDNILIEDKASGTQLIQELRHEGLSAATAYVPTKDKVMRLHAQAATIEGGLVFLPREAHWREDFLHEVTAFPHTKFDDQTDALAQALEWIKRRDWFPGAGFYEYYRELAEKQSGKK